MPKVKVLLVKENIKLIQHYHLGLERQIDSLPEHAQHIFKKAHANAVKQYQDPEKRRGGKSQSAEEVAHKAAWVAVKQKYKKKGDEWVSKD